MNPMLIGILLLAALFGSMLLFVEAGRRAGEFQARRDPEGAKAGLGTVDGAVFALMGLMIAFTFSGASTRFDARRAMAVEEANCIGTAWLRLDLLPTAAQPSLRDKFRDYTTARLAAFQKVPDLEEAKAELGRADALQAAIWTQAVAACRDSGGTSATMLLLPSLNEMFDAAATRTRAALMHPPGMIYGLLFLLVLASSMLAGYNLGVAKVRTWVHTLTFVAAIVLAVYVILDFEFPRIGLIRIHAVDQVFVDLLGSMKR
jgi:hypothetical protein